MKDRLSAFITDHGSKHWSFAARRDADFMAWVSSETVDLPAETPFAERVWCATSGTRPACTNGSRQKFKSVIDGWGFCGPAAKCPCAREAVSEKVRESQKNRNQSAIHAKRVQTNIERYGVTNTGQIEPARAAHRAFYADDDKVIAAVGKGRETMLERYGVENALQLPEVDAHRRALARNLTPEQKESRSIKRRAHAAAGGLLAHGYDRVKLRVGELGIHLDTPREAYVGTAVLHYYDFTCKRCGIVFSDYIKDGHEPACPKCDATRPSYVSKQEDAVAEYIQGLDIGVLRSVRRIVKNNEIDIVVPSHRIAIEFCGLFWHSDYLGKKTPEYHQTKTDQCEAAGYRLITIFSDEWEQKPAIVKARLRHALGLAERRLHARKLEVRPVETSRVMAFYDEHHIQGRLPARRDAIHLGLWFGNELVSAMTFGSLRLHHNTAAKEGHWELYRFASSCHVNGGASRMFKRFLVDQAPDFVVSYCDRRWGQGGVYQALGFQEVSKTKPGYSYVTKPFDRRYNRSNFTKQKLVANGGDRSLSETEIMQSRGYNRIWDCGHIKFGWTK